MEELELYLKERHEEGLALIEALGGWAQWRIEEPYLVLEGRLPTTFGEDPIWKRETHRRLRSFMEHNPFPAYSSEDGVVIWGVQVLPPGRARLEVADGILALFLDTAYRLALYLDGQEDVLRSPLAREVRLRGQAQA